MIVHARLAIAGAVTCCRRASRGSRSAASLRRLSTTGASRGPPPVAQLAGQHGRGRLEPRVPLVVVGSVVFVDPDAEGPGRVRGRAPAGHVALFALGPAGCCRVPSTGIASDRDRSCRCRGGDAGRVGRPAALRCCPRSLIRIGDLHPARRAAGGDAWLGTPPRWRPAGGHGPRSPSWRGAPRREVPLGKLPP